MPEVVGAADEQAIDKMQVSSKGRERVPVRFITTTTPSRRFAAEYGNLTGFVPSQPQLGELYTWSLKPCGFSTDPRQQSPSWLADNATLPR
jgi:hypothetical protein